MIRGKLGEQLVRMIHTKFRENCTEIDKLYDEKAKFKIKNSYFTQKLIEIDSGIPTYTEFDNDKTKFEETAKKVVPTFSDDNWILSCYGYCVQFRDAP